MKFDPSIINNFIWGICTLRNFYSFWYKTVPFGFRGSHGERVILKFLDTTELLRLAVDE